MIFGIMSDTHGHVQRMHRVADTMTAEHGVTFIYHLGDDYCDAEQLRWAGHEVRGVPGLWCDEYRRGRVPKTIVETIDWLTVSCVHADKDLGPREKAAHLVLFGHTHEAEVRRVGRSVWLNPGHLKAEHDRGEAASYGLTELTPEKLIVCIYELHGLLRERHEFSREELHG
ncbi:MAG: metallophosphoesterase family protein [Candidatus Hydrogenedentota bacterium]